MAPAASSTSATWVRPARMARSSAVSPAVVVRSISAPVFDQVPDHDDAAVLCCCTVLAVGEYGVDVGAPVQVTFQLVEVTSLHSQVKGNAGL